MALRVCGAEVERDTLSASRCWCGGLFCGRGGFKASREFRRAFHPTTVARTRGEFDELMLQADLLDGDHLREKWAARVATRRPKCKRPECDRPREAGKQLCSWHTQATRERAS